MGIGIIAFGTLSDRLVTSKLAEGKQHRPEIRLTPFFTLPAGITLPIGLFIYGWTIEHRVHWIVPMLGKCATKNLLSPGATFSRSLTRPIGVVIFAFGLMGVMVRAWSAFHPTFSNDITNVFKQMCVQNYLLVRPLLCASRPID